MNDDNYLAVTNSMEAEITRIAKENSLTPEGTNNGLLFKSISVFIDIVFFAILDRPKLIYIDKRKWTIENGMLSDSQKKNRKLFTR